MTITRYEQSGTIIKSNSGQTLGIDIGALTPIEKLAGITVDQMLVSHIHADHCSADQILALNPAAVYAGAECLTALGGTGVNLTELTAGETVTIGNFTVTPFEVDHGPSAPQVPEQNFGFLIEVDGEVIYFAGDMFTPSGIDVTDLSVDVALLPVGGHFTFDPEAALSFAQTFASIRNIYPMHHEAVGPIDTEGGKKFTELASGTFTIAG